MEQEIATSSAVALKQSVRPLDFDVEFNKTNGFIYPEINPEKGVRLVQIQRPAKDGLIHCRFQLGEYIQRELAAGSFYN